MSIKEILTENGEETRAAAADFAKSLKAGDIVCLYGDLGAGKTTFCQAAIAALGVREPVTSPTFNIVKEYKGESTAVYHFDVYRVHSEEDMFEIGYEDCFYGGGICFIEWAELIEDLLPENVIKVFLEYTDEEDGRKIRIEYTGD